MGGGREWRVDIWFVLAQVVDAGSVIFLWFCDRNSQARLQLVRKPSTPAAGMSAAGMSAAVT